MSASTGADLARAMLTVVSDLAESEGRMDHGIAVPSLGVQQHGMKTAAVGPLRAIVYRVPGQSLTYPVILYVGRGKRKREIHRAECPCAATTTCYHLVAALTQAYMDGYRLIGVV